MLQQEKPKIPAACHSSLQALESAPNAASLIGKLQAAGLQPEIPDHRDRQSGSGVSMLLSVQELLGSQHELERLAGAIRHYLLADLAVTMTLRDLGEPGESTQALEAFCLQLHHNGVPRSRNLGVCLGTAALPLRAFSLITRCWLGDGPRYALLGAPQMQQFDTDTWEYLWRFRAGRWAVFPAYAETVATPCPLLADEAASAILPTFGLQASADTAWLPMRLHLPRFADQMGIVCLDALNRASLTGVSTGERLLDLLQWPTEAMSRDSRSNRRIAINVTGFGELVRLQNKAPSDFYALQSLLQIAQHIRDTLWKCSAHIASRSELLPAIAKHEPSFAASDEHHSRNWANRWQAAIERSAVRHRNLLVMSPYSVLPTDDAGCAAYADLLPVIGFADAHSFAAAPPLKNWKIKEFCHFHRRARAVMQHRNAVSLVATRA
jgi:hypothetical protein